MSAASDPSFVVGGRYANSAGEYDVLAIENGSVRIRYGNGFEMRLPARGLWAQWQEVLRQRSGETAGSPIAVTPPTRTARGIRLPRERVVSPPRGQLGTLRTRLTDGERRVFEFFDALLPLEWEIYVQPHLNGLRPDFVLLNPEVGIGVFEVKDWNIEGKDLPRNDNPVAKVVLYKHQILNLYCPRLGIRALEYLEARAVVTAGIIIVGTSTERAKDLLRPNQTQLCLLGRPARYHPIAGWDALERKDIDTVFPDWRRARSGFMEQRFADDLRTWLVEPDHAATQREPLSLDARQRSIVTTPPSTKSGYRRIKGPAGSGKSLVVAARAAHLAMEGRDVLVISYNITLLHYLRDLAVRYPEPGKGFTNRITWLHFHGWCKQVCVHAGMEAEYRALWHDRGEHDVFVPDHDTSDEILETKLPALVARVLDEAGNEVPRYDAVLVDEGQDFNLDWWNVLRKVCRPGGEMLLVADETQDIYGRAKSWTDEKMNGAGFLGGTWTRLESSYRLPERFVPLLRRYVDEYLGDVVVNLPKGIQFHPQQARQLGLDVEPVKLRWLQVSPDVAAETCVEAVCSTPGFADPETVGFSDVTLLINSHEFGLRCVEMLQGKGVEVAHVFDSEKSRQRVRKLAFFMGDARVKACTIQSFKGWEARALVVYVGSAQSLADRALVYVGLSRLKRHARGSFLTVVCAAPELEAYGKAWQSIGSFERVDSSTKW